MVQQFTVWCPVGRQLPMQRWRLSFPTSRGYKPSKTAAFWLTYTKSSQIFSIFCVDIGREVFQQWWDWLYQNALICISFLAKISVRQRNVYIYLTGINKLYEKSVACHNFVCVISHTFTERHGRTEHHNSHTEHLNTNAPILSVNRVAQLFVTYFVSHLVT